MTTARTSIVAAFASACLLLGAGAEAQDLRNLLLNPSFKEACDANGEPPFWKASTRKSGEAPAPELKISLSPEGQDDSSAVCLSVPRGSQAKGMAELSQLVPAKPSTRCYFAFRLLSRPGQCWRCGVVEELDKDRKVKGTFRAIEAEGAGEPGAYRLHEISFVTRPETRFLNVSLRLQNLGWGEALFDNVKLCELPSSGD